VVRRDLPHHQPEADPYSQLVYACRPSDVRATVIDGVVVTRKGALTWAGLPDLAVEANQAAARLRSRAGV